MGVSILVLVDVALELDRGRHHPGTPWRFQSLFSWMSLWNRIQAVVSGAPQDCFNPCSRGCRSGTFSLPRLQVVSTGFQSLFSWMSLWNSGAWRRGMDVRGGFNPCSRGCRSGTRWPNRDPARGSWFQSLFSWMSLWNNNYLFTVDGERGFNPCSRGCRSGTCFSS